MPASGRRDRDMVRLLVDLAIRNLRGAQRIEKRIFFFPHH